MRNVVGAATAAILMSAMISAPAPLAQTNAEANCHHGCPDGSPTSNTVIARSIYVLSNNPSTRFSDWLAYRVQPDFLDGQGSNRNWKQDPDLAPEETMHPSDYDDAHVALRSDRGHQAPLASFKGSDDIAQTNYLSNITPQFTKLNQGAWKDLESAVRQLARNHPNAAVFVMTGPLYEWPMAKLPATNKDHEVPSAYWKVIALVGGDETRVASFYFYQDTPKRADFCDHARTVDFIERKSGLDLFSAMPDAQEGPLEESDPTLVDELGCRLQ